METALSVKNGVFNGKNPVLGGENEQKRMAYVRIKPQISMRLIVSM